MKKKSYQFDPCSIDGSDQEDISLDDWKPTVKTPKIVQSKWRQESIGDDFNQQPGLDELRKIHTYLKKKASDAEIMRAFGISAETLIAIKKDNYSPVEGISLDNQSKIYKEFKRLEAKILSLSRGMKHIGKIMFIDEEEKLAFKKAMKKPKSVKKKKLKCEENDEFDAYLDEEE